MKVLHRSRGWTAVWSPGVIRRRSQLGQALYELRRAGLLDDTKPTGPDFFRNVITGDCPVCGGPTAVGWWKRDDETGEWQAITSPPTPCTKCRAVIMSAATTDDAIGVVSVPLADGPCEYGGCGKPGTVYRNGVWCEVHVQKMERVRL
jgi:hypothetical protein